MKRNGKRREMYRGKDVGDTARMIMGGTEGATAANSQVKGTTSG